MANSRFLRAVLMQAFIDRSLFLALHAADPGEGGAGELTGQGYVRQVIRPIDVSEGVISNGDTLRFENLPEGTMTHFGVWDAERSGHFLMGGPLLEPKRALAGNAVQWDEGECVLRIG